MAKLKEEEIIDRWSVLIGEANGKGKEIFKKTQENLKETETPRIQIVQKIVSPSLIRKMRGEGKTFLVVQHTYLKGYLMYIGATDYGKQLFVSWYLTLEPSWIWKLIGSLPWWILIFFLGILIPLMLIQALRRKIVAPGDMDVFDLEELTAYTTTVHHALIDAAKEVSESVDFDFTKVDLKSRGFLNIS